MVKLDLEIRVAPPLTFRRFGFGSNRFRSNRFRYGISAEGGQFWDIDHKTPLEARFPALYNALQSCQKYNNFLSRECFFVKLIVDDSVIVFSFFKWTVSESDRDYSTEFLHNNYHSSP